LSALLFHQLTTQDPAEVWIAIGQKSRHPKEDILPLRVVRFSGPALQEGITEHRIQGASLRVYNPAKTVADCFKFRNKIGIDVAAEALRDCLRNRKCSVDELWYFARVCRVANIMKPYMEAMVSA
jgi:predicted transcriptional regulator of viral defense system